MRKPIHALANVALDITVFEKGKRNIDFTTSGVDPSKIAKQVSDKLPEDEKKIVRPGLRKALKDLIEHPIAGMDTCQIKVGDRRVRVGISEPIAA